MGSDDEDYVALGTPLEPLEEEDALARKKPVAIQDQIVTDENGRRRFHGAFTGGFAAGYYNTVGSKEGWTPATFKSTRKDRKAIAAQSTRDFMDEEDIGAFGIAPQTLRPTEDFDTKKVEKSKRPRLAQSSGPIPGEPVLFKIIQPVAESMGVKVLRKMGWRPGQGVGPKFRKKKKKKDNSETAELEHAAPEEGADDSSARTYGCALPPGQTKGGSDSSDSDASDENIPTSLIAPDDVHCPLYNPKENRFGLGYQGLDRSSVFSGRVDLFGPSLQFRVENKKMDIAGEAFGIGVFEDADEEVYSREDMTQYDFALETPEEKKRRMKQEAREKRKNKKSSGSALPGFVPAKIVDVPRKYYPPPQLPPGYVPVHGVKKSRFSQPERREEDAKADEVRKQGLDRHQLSRDERRVLLEDNSATKEPPKIISFTSGGTQVDTEEPTPPANPQPPVKETPKPEVDSAARMERLKKFAEVLQAYSSSKTKSSQDTFQPFSKHPGKQERYEKYLTLKAAGYGECLKDLQPPEMTEWEREREKMEFERASSLYKPLAGEMSSRFVTAKSHDISHLVPDKEKEKEKDPTQDPKVAAKMCLFGKLTHKVEEWHPDRLVCKRFNVPHPYPNSKMVGVRKETEAPKGESESMETDEPVAEEAAPKKSLFANLDFSKPPPGLPPPGESVPSSSAVKEWPQLDFQKAQAESEAAPEEEAPPPKPPIDLFKQIFADTSESEEETEEAEKTIQTTTSSSSKASDPKSSQDKLLLLHSSSDTKLKQDDSKGGIFQNLDLDKLSSKPTTSLSLTDPSKSTTPIKRMTAAEAFDDTEDEPIYGPAAPSLLTPRSKANPSSQSHTFSSTKISTSSIPTTSEVWIEKGAKESSKKKKRKHKKEHKSHHKVKKNKKKSSKHKKHRQKLKKTPSKARHNKDPSGSSSSSSSDSDDGDDSGGTSTDTDVPQISEKNRAIIETLKRLL